MQGIWWKGRFAPVVWVDLVRLRVDPEGTVAIFCFEADPQKSSYVLSKVYHEISPGDEIWEKAGISDFHNDTRFIRCVPCGQLSLHIPAAFRSKADIMKHFQSFN